MFRWNTAGAIAGTAAGNIASGAVTAGDTVAIGSTQTSAVTAAILITAIAIATATTTITITTTVAVVWSSVDKSRAPALVMNKCFQNC